MGKKKRLTDLHGYEVHGFDEAKTVDDKIEAVENHLEWLRLKEIEVKQSMEEILNSLYREQDGE